MKENHTSNLMVSLPSGEYPEPGDEGVLRKVGDTTRDAIARHVQAAFKFAKRNREANNVDEEFSLALHQMRGEYPPEVLAQFKTKGIPAIYLPVTDTKCRGLLARLSEVVGCDDIVEIRISAVPEPPVSVVESIVQRSMQALEAVENSVGYGTGFLHCLIPVNERRLGWKKRKGKAKPVMEDRLTLKWKNTAPWDVFPQPGVMDVQQGDLCVRVRYFPQELKKFVDEKMPGWIPDAITAALSNPVEKRDARKRSAVPRRMCRAMTRGFAKLITTRVSPRWCMEIPTSRTRRHKRWRGCIWS